MGRENSTFLTEFILTGFTQHQELQLPLFLVFLIIYVLTIVWNFGLIALIWKDPHLHIPMYIFLGNLAFVDACLSSTVTPKMLVDFRDESRMISYSQCMTQFFSFAIWATVECFLLSAMAYDRYIAICSPLLYPVIVTNTRCIWLIVLSYASGLVHALIHGVLLFRLTFCNSNIIQHFYCDIMPLLKISCTDTSIDYLMLFIFAGLIQLVTIGTVIISYTLVLFTILRAKSMKSVRKAFSTCGAHLLSVSLYYGTLFIMYVLPTSQQADDPDMMDSLFYTVIIPVLNPVIYSLRNKQVIDSLRKILKKHS
ncbi:olfactory receptor 5H8-like [Perognathus longimembris pacificus]|uniref:olfactory receptor 5H8-like n=1 Tax=Perognathus longimembris pacificus TaxID=214514 RepID=UPI0020186DCA|nr:olfactory receptor 5H8-like [Perognathus longimembris pacificus]